MDPYITIAKGIFNSLGGFYKENIYHSSFEIELRERGISFQSEVICPIVYKNIQVGFERADIVVYSEGEMKFIIEFKAQIGKTGNKEIQQLRKYLKNFNVDSGLLINFSNNLEIVKVTKEDSFIIKT
jgi:GxxExxY protein